MAATPGTVLVIGIIAGAIIAVILIVIIVLKMRTRVEGNFKVEESTNVVNRTRTYQFQQNQNSSGQQHTNNSASASIVAPAETTPLNPDGSDQNDTGFETPSIVGISNMPGTKATVIPASNGFYEKYVNNNGKKNGGKPIREWYV